MARCCEPPQRHAGERRAMLQEQALGVGGVDLAGQDIRAVAVLHRDDYARRRTQVAGAALIAALLPLARSLLSMGAYRAVPEVFARVDERSGSPVGATVACAVSIAAVLIVLSIVSNNVLGDSISAPRCSAP
jgi:hypothetical protein